MENDAEPDTENREEISGENSESREARARLLDINERQNVPRIDELEKKLLEQPVNSEEEAFMLYCEYAQAMGFSVRRSKQYYFEGTRIIRSKTYCCRKEGPKEDKGLTRTNRKNFVGQKEETRTGCKAMISFACNRQGEWKVSKFVKDHNHKLSEPYAKSLLMSGRAILANNSHALESSSEVDKIRELSLQLADARTKAEASARQAAVYKRQLDAIVEHIEEHNESLSRKIQKVLVNVVELEGSKDDVRNRFYVNHC